ncbi:MAG: WD repeat protein [Lasallia pustulata]|uniref:Ribosome assembly protein 4 n=1 Tax=Lasallia pustulata TaxID=136370 RepID=A0A5M8PR02_9LECA|nr:MAG: WD repeat protein [Lasallia pustulata]
MATVLPPPSKRQRTAVAERTRAQQDIGAIPDNLGSIRVQFFDQATGQSTGAPVSVPVVDATVKNLELLLNTLQGNNPSERVPYRFTFRPETADSSPIDNSLDITADLYQSLLRPGLKTTEDFIHLQYTPQAVFRVRAVSRCSSSIPGHGEAILATQFSPSSSSTMVSGSGDATARIWDCDTGTPLHTLKGHTSWILVTTWSPDGTTIATGSMDNTVRTWDAKTGQPQGTQLKGHTKWITSLAWEPYHLQSSGRPRIASSSKDATVRIWDAVSKRIEMVLSGHKGSVSCVRWGGTGRIYTCSHDKTIKVWDASKGTLIHTLSAHAHWVNHLALSTDFVLRTAYHDHTGEIPTTEEAKVAKAKERFEKAATVNSEILERLVTASDDFTMYLWEPSKTIKPLSRLLGHQKQVNHVTFSPDGLYIASAGWDNHVKLWNARNGKFIATLRGHVSPVYQTCFSPDSRLLVSGSKDTTLKVWDVRTAKLKEDLPGHKDEVYAVDWSPDGMKVGSGGKDKAIRIWRH